MTDVWYYLGVDVGQRHDPTALALLEVAITTDLTCRDGATFAHPKTVRRVFRLLERLELGTPYPAAAARVAEVAGSPKLGGRVVMALDATGVGRPFLDMLKTHSMNGAKIVPTVMTAGREEITDKTGTVMLPKRDLVSDLAIALDKRTIEFANGLPLMEVLLREFQNFKLKFTKAGNDQYEAWRSGDHDDLVFAVALATWAAGRKQTHFGERSGAIIWT